jgi:NADH-quinone oxidoreductase subunit K
MNTPQPYLILSALLFSLGMVVVLVRKDPLIVLLGVELILQAVNLALGALAIHFQDWDGQITTAVTITIASAELLIGLGILWARNHRRSSPSPLS